jgi:two-component system sensor histidine kinase DesK
MRDVEGAARMALQEVRDAVAGYRQPALTAELENAREVLSAAGIAFELQGEIDGLPVSREAALAWAVREGVTNVVKHSRARRCTISFLSENGSTGLEVWDDGAGIEVTGSGSGLTGLRERLANYGGWCEAGPDPRGGFRLMVGLPREDGRLA